VCPRHRGGDEGDDRAAGRQRKPDDEVLVRPLVAPLPRQPGRGVHRCIQAPRTPEARPARELLAGRGDIPVDERPGHPARLIPPDHQRLIRRTEEREPRRVGSKMQVGRAAGASVGPRRTGRIERCDEVARLTLTRQTPSGLNVGAPGCSTWIVTWEPIFAVEARHDAGAAERVAHSGRWAGLGREVAAVVDRPHITRVARAV